MYRAAELLHNGPMNYYPKYKTSEELLIIRGFTRNGTASMGWERTIKKNKEGWVRLHAMTHHGYINMHADRQEGDKHKGYQRANAVVSEMTKIERLDVSRYALRRLLDGILKGF